MILIVTALVGVGVLGGFFAGQDYEYNRRGGTSDLQRELMTYYRKEIRNG